jgi:hypothetical protein
MEMYRGVEYDHASRTTPSTVPEPFNEHIMRNALEELSDGARLAVQTCLDLWRNQVFHSTTLKEL